MLVSRANYGAPGKNAASPQVLGRYIDVLISNRWGCLETIYRYFFLSYRLPTAPIFDMPDCSAGSDILLFSILFSALHGIQHQHFTGLVMSSWKWILHTVWHAALYVIAHMRVAYANMSWLSVSKELKIMFFWL